MNEPQSIGNVPRSLMDAYTRQHRLTDRAFGKIGDYVLSFAVRFGFEVLTGDDGIPLFEDESLFAFFVRKKSDNSCAGFLVIDDTGDITFVEMSKDNDARSSDVLYG